MERAPLDPVAQAEHMRAYMAGRIALVRSVMRFDHACDQIVPSDLRMLVGEIDRLQAQVDRLKAHEQPFK